MPKNAALLLLPVVMCGCAALGGPGFTLGLSTQADILAQKGAPSFVWEEPDGEKRLFWTTGPNGTSTVLARIDKENRLSAYEEVLNQAHFSEIQAGMTMEQVTRMIGPPYPAWTTYFKARDELVWEWRYCDSSSTGARFYVLFDGTSKKVRSTMSLNEFQLSGSRTAPSCGQTYIRLGSPTATYK